MLRGKPTAVQTAPRLRRGKGAAETGRVPAGTALFRVAVLDSSHRPSAPGTLPHPGRVVPAAAPCAGPPGHAAHAFAPAAPGRSPSRSSGIRRPH